MNYKNKMNNIKVSVFCLAYNHQKYIHKALDSILEQETNFAFEIIVNDDASTDDTPRILKEYKKKYPNIIKPIFHDKNEYSCGELKSYSKILKYSNGEYIAFCECDDYWIDKKKLQVQYDAMISNPSINLCFCKTLVVSENGAPMGKILGDFGIKEKIIPIYEIIRGSGSVMGTNSIMVRKNVFGDIKKFYDEYGQQPVGDFIIQNIGSYPNGSLYIPFSFATYRKNSVGSWSTRMKNMDIYYENLIFRIKMNNSLNNYFDGKYSKIYNYHIKSLLFKISKLPIDFNEKKKVITQYRKYLSLKEYLLCNFVISGFGFYIYQKQLKFKKYLKK